MKKILLILAVTSSVLCNSQSIQKNKKEITNSDVKQPKVQVLLMGSSHWAHYQQKGYDVAQTKEIDILSDQYQAELDEIVAKIAEFKPTKVFVERTVAYQPKLDSLYNLYKTSDWGKKKRNEIIQLGFKVAKRLGQNRVYGIDYGGTFFPYDSLITVMKSANQQSLIAEFEKDIKEYEKDYNTLVANKTPLRDIFYYLNNKSNRKSDLSWYISKATKAGDVDNHVGAFLASEWMRRNIYSYGILQKYTEPDDERIMVLMGSSHISVFENLIQYNPDWEAVELKDILE